MQRAVKTGHQLCRVDLFHRVVLGGGDRHLCHLGKGQIFAHDVLFDHIDIARNAVILAHFYPRGDRAKAVVFGFRKQLRQGGEPAPAFLELVAPVRPDIDLDRFALPPFADRGFKLLHLVGLRDFFQRKAIARQIVGEDFRQVDLVEHAAFALGLPESLGVFGVAAALFDFGFGCLLQVFGHVPHGGAHGARLAVAAAAGCGGFYRGEAEFVFTAHSAFSLRFPFSFHASSTVCKNSS